MFKSLWKRTLTAWGEANCRTPLKPQGLSAWGLSMVLGVSSAIALTTLAAIPQAAQAYTARLTLFITRGPGESYDTFLRRAEAVARAGIQRSFDADLLTTAVVVTIVGENQGLSIPIMEVDVTRNEWRDRPDPQYWARYYESAPELLNF